MNSERAIEERRERLVAIVVLLEKNLRYIETLGVAELILQDYRKVLAYLRTKSPTEIEHILGKKTSKQKKEKVGDEELNLTDEAIGRLSGEQIKEYLERQQIARAFLERVAAIRFGVTKGALSMLRSREALKEKIHTLLAHEGTHDAISRAALGQSKVRPMDEDSA